MPVFEAVVNSIHSIEEKGNTVQGRITLTILREPQGEMDIGDASCAPILGFKVSDNGCGFNDVNFDSFQTLDSDHKIDKGCRGVGRLLWLKAFDEVNVASVFHDHGLFNYREFSFNSSNGVHDDKVTSSEQNQTGSVITLNNFDKAYRKAVPSGTKAIANALLEHCLWYFVRDGGVPNIHVEDGFEKVDLYQLFDTHMHSQVAREQIDILGEAFELTHIKFRASVNKKHQLSLCAANRLVKEEGIQGKLPGLYQKISDETGEFVYTCYVSSKFLDDNVRAERTSFEIAESFDGLFAEQELSLRAIREEVLKRAQVYLEDVLEKNISAGKRRIDEYIVTHAPRYRPITSHIEDKDLIIDPDKSDKDVELHLHEQWYAVERQLLCEGQHIMKPNRNEQTEDYEERVQSYLKKVEDLKKSDLANYVSHRKVIIDLLEKSIERTSEGKYAKEEIIHELIMPMRKDSSEVFLDSCNLWLVDERLAFHNYLASDKPLSSMPILETDSGKEPDLLAINVYDNPMLVSDKKSVPLASITVVEIKRPMRNDVKAGEDKDPIEQALGYLERVREGETKTPQGRPIPHASDIPGYCYVIADLTPSLLKRCKMLDLQVTHDHLGYFGYNKGYKAYIEVISFDRLVNMAKERNKAFFDKLGLPMS
ncbi:ATP-binding protein [Vibrio parahaemolyticus]|nr:ATP-binding protein [Vibrio parahaemolyticus]EHH1248588.1 ATP-binding protein [Vibrio parahaemolyticus]EHW0631862.1 ATP-binding protein [Vibrio parahaemolyticus]EJA3304321.1 ATP-binding protein [Vibrio parahaemolyticus]EJG0665288.1 ATP-binding protein [Vibrio parahaemolyticus]